MKCVLMSILPNRVPSLGHAFHCNARCDISLLHSAVSVSSEDTLRDALTVQELMTSPMSNMRGDDVTQDYEKGIAHVRLTLDELRERKLRTDELCDVRRIKLQQLLQLKQSERDAEQVKKKYTNDREIGEKE